MYSITQVNDVPNETKANQLIAVAKEADNYVQAYKFPQPNGKYTVIVVRTS